jgi:DNA-binding PadR family transcriptional regulator
MRSGSAAARARLLPNRGKAQVAREMEFFERGGIVRIETSGNSEVKNYRLTEAGRDWLLDRMKRYAEAASRLFAPFKDVAADPKE